MFLILQDIVVKTWPMLCGSVLYLIQAYLFHKQGNVGFSGAFVCYAGANLFLIYAALFYTGSHGPH